MIATPQGYTEYLPVGGSGALELRWADKAVADSIPYTLDCTAFLTDAGNDSINASTVTIAASPNTLTIGAPQSTGTTLTCQISGGVVTNPVADYAINVAFTTVGGIAVNRNIWLRVWPLSPNKTFSTDLVVVQGPAGPPGPAGATGPAGSAGSVNLATAFAALTLLAQTAFATSILAAAPLISVQTGAAPITLQQRFALTLNVRDIAGTDPTGATDNAAAWTTALNMLSAMGGGTLQGNPGEFYKISNLLVPGNCGLDCQVNNPGLPANGVWGLNAGNAFNLGPGPGGTILLEPSGSISLGHSAKLRRLRIVNASLPTPTTAAEAQAAIYAFSGTAVIGLGTHNELDDVAIIGFNQAFSYAARYGRMHLRKVNWDCTNGFAVSVSGDYDTIEQCKSNNYYIGNISQNFPDGRPVSLTVRQGSAYTIGNCTDALTLLNNSDFGHTNVFNLTGPVYLLNVIGGGSECNVVGWGPKGLNLGTGNPLTSPVVAFKSVGGPTQVRFTGFEFGGREYELVPGHSGTVKCVSCVFSSRGEYGAYVYTNIGSNAWSVVADPQNIGNGTFTTGPVIAGGTQKGGYYLAFSDNSGDFSVTDPAGNALPGGSVNVPYVSSELTFTLGSGSTPFAAGDDFTLTYNLGLDISLTACNLGGGPNINVYFNQNLTSASIVQCQFQTSTTALSVADQVLPVLTCVGNSYPATASAINPYEGMVAGTPLQYKTTSNGALMTAAPVLTSLGEPVYPTFQFGSPASPIGNIFLEELFLSGANYTAAGTNEATATPITTAEAFVTGTAPDTGVVSYASSIAPQGFGFARFTVANGGNNPLNLYPGASFTFVGSTAGTPFVIPIGYSLHYWQTGTGTFQPISLTPISGNNIQAWAGVSLETAGYTLKDSDVGCLVQFANSANAVVKLETGGQLQAQPGNVIGLQMLGTSSITLQPQTGVTLNGSNASITLMSGDPSEYRLTLNGDGESWTLTGPPQYPGTFSFDTSGNFTITAQLGSNIVLEGFMASLVPAMGQWLLANANNPATPATGEIFINGALLGVGGA